MLLDGIPHYAFKICCGTRFRDESEDRTSGNRIHRDAQIRLTRKQHAHRGRREYAHGGEEGNTVHLRHVEVGDDHREWSLLACTLKRSHTASLALNREPSAVLTPNGVEYELFVVDDEHRWNSVLHGEWPPMP